MKTRIPKRVYTAQYREAAVGQVHRGQTAVKRGAELHLSEAQAELTHLRAENAQLRVDNEILKRAAAYFARQSR